MKPLCLEEDCTSSGLRLLLYNCKQRNLTNNRYPITWNLSTATKFKMVSTCNSARKLHNNDIPHDFKTEAWERNLASLLEIAITVDVKNIFYCVKSVSNGRFYPRVTLILGSMKAECFLNGNCRFFSLPFTIEPIAARRRDRSMPF